MVKKRLTLFERYRRQKRIVRYLYRRGTLFRSKVPEKQIPFNRPNPPKKKTWRPWRKIRYLMRKGSLFRKKKGSGVASYQPPSFSQNRTKGSKFSPYLTYRRIRFLFNTGRLFSKKNPVYTVKKRKRKTFRKIRFLLSRGTLFKIQSGPIKFYWKNYFRLLLKPDYFKIIINSTVLFLLAYFIVFSALNFTTSISALIFDIKSDIYYYKIDFLIRGRDWTVDAIKVVFSSGPFFCLILSLVVLIIYINISHETWFIRLLLFWIYCHFFIHFFGEMLVGTILMKGFGLSLVYMFLLEYKKLLIILGSLFFLIFSGFALTKISLFSGNTYFNMLTKVNRSYFLQSQFLIPYFLGYIILILIKIPEITEFDALVNLTMLLMILPIVIRGRSMKDLFFDPETRRIKIHWILLLITGIILFLFRVLFGFGVRIG